MRTIKLKKTSSDDAHSCNTTKDILMQRMSKQQPVRSSDKIVFYETTNEKRALEAKVVFPCMFLLEKPGATNHSHKDKVQRRCADIFYCSHKKNGLYKVVDKDMQFQIMHGDVVKFEHDDRYVMFVISPEKQEVWVIACEQGIDKLTISTELTQKIPNAISYFYNVLNSLSTSIELASTDALVQHLSINDAVLADMRGGFKLVFDTDGKHLEIRGAGQSFFLDKFSKSRALELMRKRNSEFIPPFYADDLDDDHYADEAFSSCYKTQESNLYKLIMQLWYERYRGKTTKAKAKRYANDTDDSCSFTHGSGGSICSSNSSSDDDVMHPKKAKIVLDMGDRVLALADKHGVQLDSSSTQLSMIIEVHGHPSDIDAMCAALSRHGAKAEASRHAHAQTHAHHKVAPNVKSINIAALARNTAAAPAALQDGFVVNPLTGYPIRSDGALAKKLRKKGVLV